MKLVGLECSEFDGRGYLAFLYLVEEKKNPPKNIWNMYSKQKLGIQR